MVWIPLARLANLIQMPSESAWCSASHDRHSSCEAKKSPASSIAHRLAEQRSRDHEPLDLRRPLVDLGHLGVAVVALDGELLRVAVTAEHLDRLARLRPRHARGEQLGLRALD